MGESYMNQRVFDTFYEAVDQINNLAQRNREGVREYKSSDGTLMARGECLFFNTTVELRKGIFYADNIFPAHDYQDSTMFTYLCSGKLHICIKKDGEVVVEKIIRAGDSVYVLPGEVYSSIILEDGECISMIIPPIIC